MQEEEEIRPGQLWLDKETKDGSVYIVIEHCYDEELQRDRWLVLHSSLGCLKFGVLITEDELLEDNK